MYAIVCLTDGIVHDVAVVNTKEEATATRETLCAHSYAHRIDIIAVEPVNSLITCALDS